MGEIKVADMAQKKDRTITNRYAFLGYGAATLNALAWGLLFGGGLYIAFAVVLSEMLATANIALALMALPCALVGLFVAVMVDALGCWAVWMCADLPLDDPDGHIGLAEHCGMLLLLWNLWFPIWIYYSTKALNSKPCKKDKPVKQLLLCLFVPYYWIYWFYRQGTRVDQLPTAKKQGKTSVLCLILAFLVPVAAGYIMQKRINERIG